MNIYIAVSVLQNFLFVDAGQKSFGQGVLLGLGAYGLAVASGIYELPIIVGLGIGILAAAAGGLVFALPALRVQGFHLGFVTLSAAVVFPQLLLQMDWLTRGLNGISMPIPSLNEPLFWASRSLSWMVTLTPILALACSLWHAQRSRLGPQDAHRGGKPRGRPLAGDPSGVVGSRWPSSIAAVGTGVCGLLFVPAVSFVTPQSFLMDVSFVFFFAVVVGGRGQLLGPVIGIWAIFTLPSILLVDLAQYKPLIYGFC